MRWECTIQYNDEENPVSGYIFSDEDGQEDDDVFFYVNGEHEMKETVGQQGVDFTLISYEKI